MNDLIDKLLLILKILKIESNIFNLHIENDNDNDIEYRNDYVINELIKDLTML